MQEKPSEEHRWLERMVGEWEYEHECVMGPDQPPMKSAGSDSVRSIGLWVIREGKGQMPDGGPATMIFTLGFDPKKGRFVGTFIGSMMTKLWTYDGGLEGDVLTLDAEGPSFADPNKTAKYQDVFEIVSDDHHTLSSQVLGEDGRWFRFMTANYRRKK